MESISSIDWLTVAKWIVGVGGPILGAIYGWRRHSLADREKLADTRSALIDTLSSNVTDMVATIGTINREKRYDHPDFHNIYAEFWRTKREIGRVFYSDVMTLLETVEASLKELHRLAGGIEWHDKHANERISAVEQYTDLVCRIHLQEMEALFLCARQYYAISASRGSWLDWRLYLRP